MAQVPAPDLICVNNDTLVWDLPVVSCGTVSGYKVYGSQGDSGNFQLISDIGNPSQDFYFHEAAGGALWYYYLETLADCPGQEILSSDTLDNRIPAISPLSYVSVLSETEVEIAWETSASPEVYAYIILKNTPSGTRAIDTVFSGNTYVDTDENIQFNPVEYFVLALDKCGNTSLFDAPHQTIFLQSGEVSSCEQTIALEWTAYHNWPVPVDRYEIWYRENGAAAQLAGSVSGEALNYTFENANDQTEYCFTVRAIQSGTEISAASNEVCLTTDIVQPNRLLVAKNATYTSDGSIELDWIWNTDAEIRELAIERSEGAAAFANIAGFVTALPLDPAVVFTDEEAGGFSEPVSYRLRTVDVCGTERLSNVVNSLFLEGLASTDGQNSLNWNAYTHEYGALSRIQLFRATPSGTQVVAELSPDITAYTDLIDPNNPDLSSACYYLLADLEISLPDGTQETLAVRSNTVCLDQMPGIYIPNVFAPDGINNTEFRPFLQFGDLQEYHLMIFDRYGSMVFESRDAEQGWLGTQNGEACMQGTYVYVLRMKLSSGIDIRKEGSVLLLR